MSFKVGYCIASVSPLRAESRDASEMVSQIIFGEIVAVNEINGPWCHVKTYTDNYEGYCDIKHIHFLTDKEVNRWLDGMTIERSLLRGIETPWGTQFVYRGAFVPFGEVSDFNIGNDKFSFIDKPSTTFSSPFEAALSYLNTPYLWGGKTPFGIDCSGLTQVVFRFFDVNLPRDAYQQESFGREIDFDEAEINDLAFFANASGKITHVGIIGENYSIIHASGMVRIDQLTKNGIVHSTSGELTHHLHSIRRM